MNSLLDLEKGEQKDKRMWPNRGGAKGSGDFKTEEKFSVIMQR